MQKRAIRKPVVKEPKAAFDPRPGGVPFFISKWCPRCKGKLELLDKILHPKMDPRHYWQDEWACPTCYRGTNPEVFYDWPKSALEELNESRKRSEAQPSKSRP